MVPDLRIEEHGRIGELAHGRIVLVTVAVVLALAPLPVRGQEVESTEGGHRRGRCLPACGRCLPACGRCLPACGHCLPACGRDLRIAPALDACALVLGETGLDPRIDTGLVETGRGLLTATDHVNSVRVPQIAWQCEHDLPCRSRDRSQSRDRLPSSTDRSRSREKGRRARRDQQGGVETVKVSQAPAVSEAPAGATPVVGGASLTALPSAVQDLARFFLSLSGSSSLGAAGGVAGVAASAAGSGVQLCPSTSAGGAVALGAATAIPAGAGDPPAASAAVSGGLAPGGGVVACPAMGPTDVRRSVQGGGLLLLEFLHVVGRGTIGLPRALLRKTEPLLLLPELDVHLGVHLAIFVPLELMTARHVLGRLGRLREGNIIVQALVVDPLLLRGRRMTIGRVPLSRLTLTGMTHSGLSWVSSGAFMAWKSLQVSHQLVARLLLLRSMG